MLIMHIGSPKTGTTAIQGFLKANTKVLAQNGVNFIRAGRTNIAHNSLVGPLRRGKATETLGAIRDEIHAAPNSLHILSSEMFFSAKVAEKLGRGLPRGIWENCKVICYLRRPDKYAEAMYKQKVKNGQIDPDPMAFLQGFVDKLNYSATLDAFAKLVGEANVLVRPFDREHLVSGDAVTDFCSHAGINNLSKYTFADADSNKSLSTAVSEELGLVNRHTPFNTRVMIREISAEAAPDTIRSNDVFDRATKQKILDDTSVDNIRWQKRFCGSLAPVFDHTDLADHHPDPFPSQNEMIRLRQAASLAVFRAIGRQAKAPQKDLR